MEITNFDDDFLGLTKFAQRLEEFLQIERDFVQGSLVISLNSKYGTGKSTFLRMWRDSIEKEKEQITRPLVVMLNAWESDFYGDPLFSIISSLIDATNTKGDDPKQLIDAAKDVGWFATAIGSQVVKHLSGVDPTAAGEFAEKKKEKANPDAKTIKDSFTVFRGRKLAMEHLKKSIQEFVDGIEPYVLFLVDELDRCRPDYAIFYLETIKHLFDVKNAVFVLAADRLHLENSAKTSFGQGLDFDEYFRKFVHREINLPKITEEGYGKLATAYVAFYLEMSQKRHCYVNFSARSDEIKGLVHGIGMPPRQIQEMFRLVGHATGTSFENKGKLVPFLGLGVIFMSALKVARPAEYSKIGMQRWDPENASKFLESLFPEDEQTTNWWFALLYTGGAYYIPAETDKWAKLSKCGRAGAQLVADKDHLHQFQREWGGRSPNRIHGIYKMLEEISQFESR